MLQIEHLVHEHLVDIVLNFLQGVAVQQQLLFHVHLQALFVIVLIVVFSHSEFRFVMFL